MPNADVFERYIIDLRNTPREQQTEHSSRSALETLLNHFKSAKMRVTHEPKRAQTKGAPDFKIEMAGQVIGYVENKAIGENLDQVLKSAQIAKYKTLSNNIILTDYLRWIWIKDGIVIQDARLAESSLLDGKPQALRPERVVDVVALLTNFFSQAPTGLTRAKALAEALAVRSLLLREYLGDELVRQETAKTGGQLFGLFGAFKAQVSQELTLAEFADAFAQTLAYGLFLARLNVEGDSKLTLLNAKQYVPASVGLIRELVSFLDNLERPEYADVKWVVEEILSIINGLDRAAIEEDLSFRNRKAKRGTKAGSEEEWRLFSRDPFIYFYEDFLTRYDAKTRKSRGVYYTPPPIVNFIVRAIHDILKDTFGISAGLADSKRVTVLDFACGTGTFLVEVLERIFEELGPDSGKAESIVSNHILKNIYGFEFLIAPYTIAHLKLGQYLAERGHKMQPSERFQVYLTNTLEPIAVQANFLLPALSEETDHAQAIKEKPILVITGNPPYAVNSKNTGKAAKNRVEKYKFIFQNDGDGREQSIPMGERNSKILLDDYVKFIAFAQEKMDAVDEGVVGIITNHGFLNNPSFAGMRQSLMRSFDQIHIFDLHGNTERKEIAPDGSKDENVFDIKQGVAISLFVKKKGLERGVWRGDVWGKRQEKYEWGASAGLADGGTTRLKPQAPQRLFVIRDDVAANEYEKNCSIKDIFNVGGVGIKTANDEITIQFSNAELMSVINRLKNLDLSNPTLEFSQRNEAAGWQAVNAQRDLKDGIGQIQAIAYRPFDRRFTYYTARSGGFHDRPRGEVTRHMIDDNIALLAARSNKSQTMDHFFVSGSLFEAKTAESTTQSAGFPLYLYPPPLGSRKSKADLFGDGPDPFAGQARIENIAPAFRIWIDARYGLAVTPEQILGCIYAILHAPAYRIRYADFLRTDFPRIPLPEARADFEALSALGWDLVQAHLLKAVPKRGLGNYIGKGVDMVEKPRYDETMQTVWINATKGFANVSPAVWGFTIGGYQVIEKYLKSRKGRTLSLDEIDNVTNVANVLDFTIEQMGRIDAAYETAFGE